MTMPSTLAAFTAATLAVLPLAADAQHAGGDGSPDRGQAACGQSGSAGTGDAACGHGHAGHTHAAAGTASSRARNPGAAQVVAIEVTGQGFVPAQAAVKSGRPVTLVVTRKTDRTCATEIVLKEYGISRPLPLNEAVEVTFTPRKTGPVRYACGMDMVAGTLTVE